MTGPRSVFDRIPFRPAAARAIGFFMSWLVLTGGGAADLLPGVAAAAVAAWVSLRLLPPGRIRIDAWALCAFGLRFLGQSMLADADVARRALDPVLPLQPGFAAYSTGFPPGAARNLFTSLTSLPPGTVPAGTGEGGGLAIHCLDTRQPVAVQLAAEEALLRQAIGRPPGDG